MTRTYTFVFDPDPNGGFVVTRPALPGLVTHGATIEEARRMASDATEGYIEVLIEDGEQVPMLRRPLPASNISRMPSAPRRQRRRFSSN